jgi:hypothetical protein
MIQKSLQQITKTDLESLVSAKESERRNREYKEKLPGGRDEDKREFLYDVSSLANAAGGDLIFGIADERDADGKPMGRPASADGVQVTNLSEAIGRLDNLVRDGIKPRIPNIEWWPVDGFAKGPVVIMRVTKSLVAPHMVTFSGVSRFYSRNSTGKYPLDVGEIRSAFAASTGIGERLRSFRMDRIVHIQDDQAPIPLGKAPKIVVHLVPVATLEAGSPDVSSEAYKQSHLRPMGEISGWSRSFNFDGVLVYSTVVNTYVQVFRSGTIEAADAVTLQPIDESDGKFIYGTAVEGMIIDAVGRYLELLKHIGLTEPIFVMVTLVGVEGYKMFVRHPVFRGRKVDRDVLALPEGSIQDYSDSVATVLKPAFDCMWQACGYEQSRSYDANGNWSPKEH